MKAKCPYCGRKITYGTRLLEKGEGEHYCKHCKKPSNIVLDKGIWAVFAACAKPGLYDMEDVLFGG